MWSNSYQGPGIFWESLEKVELGACKRCTDTQSFSIYAEELCSRSSKHQRFLFG